MFQPIASTTMGQHARVIDEIEKRLVMGQGIAHGIGVIGPQPLLRTYPVA